MNSSDRDALVSGLLEAISGAAVNILKAEPEKKGFFQTIFSAVGIISTFDPRKAALEYHDDDPKFLRRLAELTIQYPCLADPAAALLSIARDCLVRRRDEAIIFGTDHIHKKRMEKVKKIVGDERQVLQRDEDFASARAFVDRVNAMIRPPSRPAAP